jgi:hypothetical protein
MLFICANGKPQKVYKLINAPVLFVGSKNKSFYCEELQAGYAIIKIVPRCVGRDFHIKIMNRTGHHTKYEE